MPGALSFQPSDGQTPEILEPSTESKVQATSAVDGAASIRVASIRQSRCVESPSAETEPPTLEEQVNTLANLPQFSRPIAGIWDEAYKCLYDKNPKLIKDYQKCLLTQSEGTALVVTAQATAVAFFGMGKAELHKQMLRAIESRTEGNEARRWKLNFLGHELAVKNLVKPVAGIIESAKDYVGVALESSAIGSAAWAGVCLLLPVRLTSSL